MKKVFAFLLLACIGIKVNAEGPFLYEGIWYEILDQEAKTCTTKLGTEFSSGNQPEGDIVLPEKVIYNGEEYTLTEIGDHGLRLSASAGPALTSITIPNTVKRIGDYAFASQKMLETIEIPGSVEYIGEHAFHACQNLLSVKLNYGLKHMGDAVFAYCHFTELVLPSTLEKIDGFFFENPYADKSNGSAIISYLETLICQSPNPPTIVDGYWYTEYACSNTILYVPNGSKEKYLQATGWKNYGPDRIKEIDGLMVFLDRTSATMVKGSTLQLKGIFSYDSSNHNMIPTEVTWSSDNESVVTVMGDPEEFGVGVVTAVGNGTANVTCSVQPNSLNLPPVTASCKVTVKDGIASFTTSEQDIELFINENKQMIIDLMGFEEGTATLTISLTGKNGQTLSSEEHLIVVRKRSAADGDLNGDTSVDETDIQLMMDYLANPNNKDLEGGGIPDLNNDRKVNSVDLEMLIGKVSAK